MYIVYCILRQTLDSGVKDVKDMKDMKDVKDMPCQR